MSNKVIINYLELAYSPVCNYDFALIKQDEYFQSLTSNSTLYIIAQRKELTIESLYPKFIEPNQILLFFEIKQKGNSSNLKCELPIYQPNLASDINREVRFHFEYALPKPNPMPKKFPQFNIRNLVFSYHDGTFIGWISPENFIQNYINNTIEANITGPINEFIKYKVHYVGKATEQKIWKRLTGHSTLQDILSLEYPLHFGTLPTHEIAILFFKFKESIGFHQIGPNDKITTDVIDTLLGNNQPSPKVISLDAEKAFINAMQPKYNKEFYKSYPVSKDGLHKYNYDSYSFKIHSPIVLQYDGGTINGAPNLFTGDSILIVKEEPLKVIKNN
jgi:hypothetical protein